MVFLAFALRECRIVPVYDISAGILKDLSAALCRRPHRGRAIFSRLVDNSRFNELDVTAYNISMVTALRLFKVFRSGGAA